MRWAGEVSGANFGELKEFWIFLAERQSAHFSCLPQTLQRSSYFTSILVYFSTLTSISVRLFPQSKASWMKHKEHWLLHSVSLPPLTMAGSLPPVHSQYPQTPGPKPLVSGNFVCLSNNRAKWSCLPARSEEIPGKREETVLDVRTHVHTHTRARAHTQPEVEESRDQVIWGYSRVCSNLGTHLFLIQ